MTDPVSLLVSACSALAGAVVFLIIWIRALIAQRDAKHEKELAYRDDTLMRVLTAVDRMSDAMATLTAIITSKAPPRRV